VRLIARSVLLVFLLSVAGSHARAADFETELARIDQALKKNPSRVAAPALHSCLRQRNFALGLYQDNQEARAKRSLAYCARVLEIPVEAPKKAAEVKHGPRLEDVQARAARELEQALGLTPDLEHGLEVYQGCAACHGTEGWGMTSGLVPQLAGQHRGVVIKQLADIRAGNRQTVVMAPYATVEVIGGVQSVADVAAYIDTLEISKDGGKGPGDQLELGERLYAEHCARCHGERGEGDPATYTPRIQAQHFAYLVRQFEWIRDGQRRNANSEMREQIATFEDREVEAVLDYVSRLDPPEELTAPEGWKNPDFAH